MKFFCLLLLLQANITVAQRLDMSKIRSLYRSAPLVKNDAGQLNQLMLQIDTDAALPVLVCYKGANEMIQAKYAINPIVKFGKFNKGKELLIKAIKRDTLNLEMRFIRYSIQNNLPAFLGYHDDLGNDKQFLLTYTKDNKDPELKEIIFNYLATLLVVKPKN